MIESWTPEQQGAFERDGFLIVEEGFIDASRGTTKPASGLTR
jgi:hypothetical protein